MIPSELPLLHPACLVLSRRLTTTGCPVHPKVRNRSRRAPGAVLHLLPIMPRAFLLAYGAGVQARRRDMAAKKRASVKSKTKAQAKPAAKRLGRPPKKPSERKAIAVNLRVTPAEKDFLERAAQSREMSMTALILAAVSFFTESR